MEGDPIYLPWLFAMQTPLERQSRTKAVRVPFSRHAETQETRGELSPNRLKGFDGKIHVAESLLETDVYLSLGNSWDE